MIQHSALYICTSNIFQDHLCTHRIFYRVDAYACRCGHKTRPNATCRCIQRNRQYTWEVVLAPVSRAWSTGNEFPRRRKQTLETGTAEDEKNGKGGWGKHGQRLQTTITQLHPPLPSPLTRNIERDAKFENCLCHTLPLYSIFFLAANSFKTFHPFVIPSTVPNSMHRSSCLFRRDINEIATKLPAQVAK